MNWRDRLRGGEPISAPVAEPALKVSERNELERLRALEKTLNEVTTKRFEPRVIPPEEHEAASPGYPMTIWSDWHWGEVVSLDETGGLNAFDYDTALVRVDRLVNNTINLLRNYGGVSPSYPGIIVCLGGDMLSGAIHDELVETNWAPPVGQAFEVHSVVAGGLLRLAEEFGAVHCPCVVGNHGRNAKKPRAKLRIRENSEYYLYKALERHFADDPRITFVVAEQTDVLFNIYDHRFLLTHGDALGTRGGDGIIGAIGPIQRGVVKIGMAERHAGRDFDTMIIGHWHSAQPRGELFPVIVNGTLKGYDEYARTFLRARPSKPSQQLWLVSPKHGIAAQWSVDL
jgi:hypothetical protein